MCGTAEKYYGALDGNLELSYEIKEGELKTFYHNFAFECREYEQGLEPPVVLRGALNVELL